MKKIIILSTLSLGILLLAGCSFQQTSQIQPTISKPRIQSSATNLTAQQQNNLKNIPEVTISTDKNNYDKGEVIIIVVKNGLDKTVLYQSGGDKFWGIEYYKDNQWINPAYEEDGGFQLTKKDIDDNCYIKLYERVLPSEFKPQANLSSQWNQKICPFGTGGPEKPRIVKYIESGKYRLIFYYGFEISKDDPYKIFEVKTVYSNAFVIK